MRLGAFSLGTSAESHPRTYLLIRMVNTALLPTLFRLKLHFDRARPNHLDPALTTEIDAPAHPAYPSGHAAQAMLFAIVLSEVNPAAADAHFHDARRIAFNREVAGVHYQSDTVAGFELARKFSALLADEPWYRMLVEHAATEWP
ncbi:MAG: phosphatase PAP2 family protein [Pseudomonadota bacterium]